MVVFLFPIVVYGDPGDGGGDPFDGGDPGAPIDTGVYALVVAALILGTLRIRKNQSRLSESAADHESREK